VKKKLKGFSRSIVKQQCSSIFIRLNFFLTLKKERKDEKLEEEKRKQLNFFLLPERELIFLFANLIFA
jgi:hypothetical protein